MTSSEQRRYSIAAIGGDGIGPEVTASAIRCVDSVGQVCGFAVDWEMLDWGTRYYQAHGAMMPPDGIERLRAHDAILLGAVGDPSESDAVTLWGLLIPIRREFRQYVNLRPIRQLPGIAGPLAGSPRVDMVIVRENSEGEYSQIGGRASLGTRETEFAVQESIFSRRAITDVTRFAVDLARGRRSRVTSATKSNGIIHTMPFWDEVAREVAESHPDVQFRSMLVDALAARMVLAPADFDVIVASNLFGDILSDLGAALTGSLGLASSGNINPEREFPSMFEAVHGSAPDIAGKGIANPIGQIGAACLMLEHLGEPTAAQRVQECVEHALASGHRTPDLGGSDTTEEFTAAVLSAMTQVS